ncbi:DHH family phosphoesterase [Thermosulfuriphilus sp.]
MDKVAKFANLIDSSQRFCLTTHVHPDGDGLGSLLALAEALKAKGKEVSLFVDDEIPSQYQWLPGIEAVGSRIPEEGFEVLVLLDCAEASRIGALKRHLSGAKVVVIDHHSSSGDLGDIAILDPQAPATGLILFRIFKALSWPLTLSIATNLYAALLTDTVCFCFKQTNQEAFAMASELVAAGVEPAKVAEGLFEHYPLRRFRLLARALDSLELHYEGRLGLMVITPEMFAETGARGSDTESFANLIRSIDTVELAVLVREEHPGQVSVSLRSQRVNVARLAEDFGGGGHVQAAGFKKKSSAREIKMALLKAAGKLLREV